jgi:MATE family multidrug resistance protein
VITADLVGSGRKDKVGALMKSGLSLAVVFCAVLAVMIVMLWYALPYLLPSTEVADIAQEFLFVMAWFIPFELFGYVFVFISNGLGKTFWVGVISFLSIPLLIVLTWALAFGNFGFEAMGIRGLAFAILITWSIRAAAFLMLVLQKEFSSIQFFGSVAETGLNNRGRILKIGVPLGVSEVSTHGWLAVIGILAAQLGISVLAAHNIAYNIFVLAHICVFGLTRATVIRLGALVGETGSGSHLWPFLKAALTVILCFSCATLGIVSLGSGQIAAYYSDDIQVIRTLTGLLILVAALRLVEDVGMFFQATLEGLQLTTKIPFVRAVTQWVLGIPICILMSQWMGLYGIWIGMGITLVCAACLFYWQLRRGIP